jgi:hypothetical protein
LILLLALGARLLFVVPAQLFTRVLLGCCPQPELAVGTGLGTGRGAEAGSVRASEMQGAGSIGSMNAQLDAVRAAKNGTQGNTRGATATVERANPMQAL